ncbi:hypothetical protein HHK36_028038 [Tetracentron sinense]|uniref:Ceramide kinase C-terminal domain-containing protein n=1 Tax=Tetracentron sinense TaxID=13715 RepID=A0A834YKA3_TETSI|nr:hypothetical protein HHK36_028038 [Tetracentron sinense]
MNNILEKHEGTTMKSQKICGNNNEVTKDLWEATMKSQSISWVTEYPSVNNILAKHEGTAMKSQHISWVTEYPSMNNILRFSLRATVIGMFVVVEGDAIGARSELWEKTFFLQQAQLMTPSSYGFYGDVITESEKYRWMGPKRYDYAGTKVFMRHRSYEAEIAFLDVEKEKVNPPATKKSERVICRVNCSVCNTKTTQKSTEGPTATPYMHPEESRWLRSRGRFLSVGAAVISCRNERAPDGLVADAHLADGFMNLILIKDCPHAYYLWHLTQLAKKGGNPLNFKFVENHKTRAFTFTSYGDESVWNLDGEIFQAHQLSVQVFRGLVSLFASGPEV